MIRFLHAKGSSQQNNIMNFFSDDGKDVMIKRIVVHTGWAGLDLAQRISFHKSALRNKKKSHARQIWGDYNCPAYDQDFGRPCIERVSLLIYLIFFL